MKISYLTLIFACLMFSCEPPRTKTAAKSEKSNELFRSTGYSAVSITKEKDSLIGGYSLNFETTNTNYIWRKHKSFSKGGWFYFYSLIKEQSKQTTADSDRPTEGKIILELTCPDTNPVSDSFNFKQPKWIDTIVANKVVYTNEYIEFYRFRDGYSTVKTLYDYYTGNEIISYSSSLTGLKDPEKFEHFIIGYLELPDAERERYNELGLYGVLSVYNPVTFKKIRLKIYRESVSAPELNFYKYLSFKTLLIKGTLLAYDRDDYLNDLETIDEKKFIKTDKFDILIRFHGVKDIDLVIPFNAGKIDMTRLKSGNFKFDVEGND